MHETAKAVIAVKAPASGVLRKILWGLGVPVPPDATIALITTAEVRAEEI